MQSKPTTVEQYLAALPEDRRAAIAAVRDTILKNLDKDYQETLQYGMIGYSVPHSVYPAGYHCDPRQPLPFAALASQKGHMSLHMMGLYIGCSDDGGDNEQTRWFKEAWQRTGKKLDMGKACIRFKKVEDVPLEVIGEAIRRIPARTYIARYEGVLKQAKGAAAARKATAKEPAATDSKEPAAKEVAKKPAAKKPAAKKPAAKKPAAATAKKAAAGRK